MRKIQKILVGIFLGGVLLGGIGTGIALVEYSSFSYGGEKIIGTENLVTRDFDYRFDPGYGRVAVGCSWRSYGRQYGSRMEADETVPPGTVRYVITYNDRTVQPYLFYDEAWAEEAYLWEADERTDGEGPFKTEMETAEENGEGEKAEDIIQGYLDVGIRNTVSDFALWMECKDEVLEDIKQHRVSSYDVAYITDIEIKVNPETMQYLLDVTR